MLSSLTPKSLLSKPLTHEQIEQCLPHAGKMSLLGGIDYADVNKLRASASSHLKADNPLRSRGRIACINGIEYAAQAMAVHGYLLSKTQSAGSVPKGYIATVRNVIIEQAFFPEHSATLDIEVVQLLADKNGFTYQFSLSYEQKALISGKITIFLIAS